MKKEKIIQVSIIWIRPMLLWLLLLFAYHQDPMFFFLSFSFSVRFFFLLDSCFSEWLRAFSKKKAMLFALTGKFLSDGF